jgi:hypothetical protein
MLVFLSSESGRTKNSTKVAGDDRYALGHLIVEGTASTDWELYRRVSRRDGLIADSRGAR